MSKPESVEGSFEELDRHLTELHDRGYATSHLTNPLDNMHEIAKADRAILWRIWDYMALWDPDRELPGADFVEFMSGLMAEDWKGDREPTPEQFRKTDVYPEDHWSIWLDVDEEDDDTQDTICRMCGEDNDDGEGEDGLCGNCADRRFNERENRRLGIVAGQHEEAGFPDHHPEDAHLEAAFEDRISGGYEVD